MQVIFAQKFGSFHGHVDIFFSDIFSLCFILQPRVRDIGLVTVLKVVPKISRCDVIYNALRSKLKLK